MHWLILRDKTCHTTLSYLRQCCDNGTDSQSQQEERGGQQAPQRFPLTGQEVAVNVKNTVQDAEAHVKAVCQYEAHTASPPCQHVGQEQERQGESQHHQVIPEDKTQIGI